MYNNCYTEMLIITTLRKNNSQKYYIHPIASKHISQRLVQNIIHGNKISCDKMQV